MSWTRSSGVASAGAVLPGHAEYEKIDERLVRYYRKARTKVSEQMKSGGIFEHMERGIEQIDKTVEQIEQSNLQIIWKQDLGLIRPSDVHVAATQVTFEGVSEGASYDVEKDFITFDTRIE